MLLSVATIARLSHVPYMRAYRFLNNGSVHLTPDEEASIRRILRKMAELDLGEGSILEAAQPAYSDEWEAS